MWFICGGVDLSSGHRHQAVVYVVIHTHNWCGVIDTAPRSSLQRMTVCVMREQMDCNPRSESDGGNHMAVDEEIDLLASTQALFQL